MGREATCECRWANQAGQCKVLLETHELILRGVISRRVSIASLTHVAVDGEQLLFHSGEEAVALTLGADQAKSWATKIATPSPTLASKLGISSATHLLLIGEFESEELEVAISEAAKTDSRNPSLILARVRTVTDLNSILDIYRSHPGNPPIWIVYPKGRDKPLGETEIRNTLRHEGFIDTKVASVSTTLTGLRFIKRT
jgi:hypothetical protein